MYSAYVRITNDRDGTMQHVIANGRTSKGMLSELSRYANRAGKHSPHSDNAIVYLWYIGTGVYDRKPLGSFKG